MKKAILLVNMGSPSSEEEMKLFLKYMFLDKAIIPAPLLVRSLLSWGISNLRYKKSWEKYLLIGGSPLKNSMQALVDEISRQFPDYLVKVGYSYSHPTIPESLDSLVKLGASEICVLPMYPHAAFSTTGSLTAEIRAYRNQTLPIQILDAYPTHPEFIKFWYELIRAKMEESGMKQPKLIFSAHAIPEQNVMKGDVYVDHVRASADAIANRLQLPYSLAFQSKIGRLKWVGPDTLELLKESSGTQQALLMIPISFLNENLETLYDLDQLILPYARKELGIRQIERVSIPVSHPQLKALFIDLIKSQHVIRQ